MNSPLRLRTLFIFMVLVMAGVVLADWALFGKDKPQDGQRVIYPTVKNNNGMPDVIEPAAGPVMSEQIINVPEHYVEIKPIEEVAVTEDEVYGPSAPTLEEALSDKQESVQKPIAPPVFNDGVPKIAIVIDDIGMNISGSRAALELPSEVVMAILPYAPKAKDFIAQSKDKGHEILIHTPMEAMDSTIDLGPMALRSDTQPLEVQLAQILDGFDGYIGINNHMGSKLTADEKAMRAVMKELKVRDLAFLDSRTIHTSVAADMAQEQGVPFAVRSVFLDHEESDAFVARALKKLERKAIEKGSAIAIGHPKEVTINGLKGWIPTLKSKGIELVPLSELLIEPEPAIAQERLSPPESQPRPY